MVPRGDIEAKALFLDARSKPKGVGWILSGILLLDADSGSKTTQNIFPSFSVQNHPVHHLSLPSQLGERLRCPVSKTPRSEALDSPVVHEARLLFDGQNT